MRLPKSVVFFILAALFLSAIAARFHSTSIAESPYFDGASAMTYRHAGKVADGVSLRAHDVKANFPDGYTPARYRAPGVEYALGWTLRLAHFFGESDGRDVARRFFVIISALCVFTAYGVARRLWACQSAGLLAAGLVAFLPPLTVATNGRELSHDAAAVLLLSLHAMSVLQLREATTRRAQTAAAIIAALAAFGALAAWEPAAWVLLAWAILFVLYRPADRGVTIAFLTAHGVAFAVALVLCPHLRSGETFPTLAYLTTRIRFLFGRPASPLLLSDRMRDLWSLDHAPLAPDTLIQLFMPLVPIALALALNRECRARRRTFAIATIVAALAAVMVALDRSVLPVAATAMAIVLAGGARSVSQDIVVRAPLIALGAFVVFAGVVFRDSGPDVAFDISRALGVAHRDPDAFLWVSLENTDRELVKFVAQRTSVQDAILAPDKLSGLLLTFTGRTMVLLPGGASAASSKKHVAMTRALYGDEASLYTLCHDHHIAYVIYSIDVALDSGSYSPRYLAAVEALDPTSIAYRMHFSPESIEHFTLAYENDHYRVFKVTEKPEPIFATDHPLFFDAALLARSGGDLETFRKNVVLLMVAYNDGTHARATGDLEKARARLDWCVRQAPRFTQARLALCDVLMDLDRYEDARAQVMEVISYAPDNSRAMYYAAFINAHLRKYDAARGFLKVLLATERDPELIEKAKLLQAYMDQGLPLEPAMPLDTK
jgi:tetratricopeptide (TPR) repeat protein